MLQISTSSREVILKNGKLAESIGSEIVNLIMLSDNGLPAIEVLSRGTVNGRTWQCTSDSEYKMLNRLASDLGAEAGGVYPEIIGVIKIVSENPYCVSCQGIIQQFNQSFPNIKLILVDGVK